MIYFLCRTAKLCQEYPKIRDNLIRHNAISHLLDLLASSTNVRLQSTVVHLLSTLFRHSARKRELRRFLKCFVQNDHLVSEFVDGLLLIGGPLENVAPSYSLRFPRPARADQRPNSDEWIESMQWLQDNYIPSPWTRSCLVCSAAQSRADLWSTGFSVSVWLRCSALEERTRAALAENRAAEQRMHVLSCGTDTALLELWLEATKASLQIRVTVVRADHLETRAKFAVAAPVTGRWHHVTLGIAPETSGDGVDVGIVVDGVHQRAFKTDLKRPARMRANEKLRLLVGELADEEWRFRSSYSVGNAMLFQPAILDKAHCSMIYAHGPDLENFLVTDCGGLKNAPNLRSSAFVPHDVEDAIFTELTRNRDAYVARLRDQMILSLSARESPFFYSYGDSRKNYPSGSNVIGQHSVYHLECSVLHPILRRQVLTFYDYLLDNGGFSFVAFLLAKVVELSECKIVHANILKFVLEVCSSNAALHSQLQQQRGYDVISFVMASASFVFSEHLFVVLVEASCNEKLYKADNISAMNFARNVRIYDPQVITTLILPHWKRWHDCNPALLIAFFKILVKLIQPRNSHQLFNAKILMEHEIVERILTVCKEKFVKREIDNANEEDDGNRKIIESVLDFVQGITSLLQIDHFKQISDFLLVIHPLTALNYQPTRGRCFWALELSNEQLKRMQIDEAEDKVDDIISELFLKYPTNTDGCCWNGPSLRSEDTDEMEAITKCDLECSACSGEDVDECILRLDCAKKFCHQCQRAFDESLGQNATSCHPIHSLLASGLLNVIRNAIVVLPDGVLETVRRDVVNDDLLVTLINHPNSSVRSAVLKTIIASMGRSPDVKNFLNVPEGFHILGDQLALHPVTAELVNGCLSLICRHGVLTGKGAPLCLLASPPLLALLPRSVPHFPVAINILRCIKTMITRTPSTTKKLIKHGLVDNLLKTLQIVIHTSICESCRKECVKALVAEIMDLFAVIVNLSLLNLIISDFKQILLEVLYKWHWLTIVEDFEWRTDGEYFRIMNNLRRRLLLTALDKTMSMVKHHRPDDKVLPQIMSSEFEFHYLNMVEVPGSNLRIQQTNEEAFTIDLKNTSNHIAHCTRLKVSKFAEDLMHRFEFVIDRNLELILFPPFIFEQEKTLHFTRKLFVVLIDAMSAEVAKVDSVHLQGNIFLRKQTIYVLLWMLSPSRPTSMRMFPVKKLHFEPNLKKVLITLFHENKEAEDKFAVFLWQLTFSKTHKLSKSELFLCEKFVQRLRHLRILSTSALEKIDDRWFVEMQTKIREMIILFWERKRIYFDDLAAFIKNYSNEVQTTTDIMRKNGFMLSGNIVQRLGAQNRKYLCEENEKNCIRVEIKISWAKIIEQFTHERALWYMRLRPFNFWAHESVARSNGNEKSKHDRNAGTKIMIRKCLKQMEYTYKKPLSYLFKYNDPNANVVSYIFMKNVISETFNVLKIQYGAEIDGELLIGERNLYFIPARDVQRVDYNSDFNIQFDSIKEIFYRTYKLKDNCVEMFLSNGKTEFLYFFSQEKRDKFIGILKNHISPKRIICCCILDVFVHKWKNGLITNYEYLNVLNKLAGRSYNNARQYPVMPLILADFQNETIDLAQPSIYRNLKKSSAVRRASKKLSAGSHGHNVFNSPTFSQNPSTGSENNDSAILEYFDVPEILTNTYNLKKNRAHIKNIKLPRWAQNNHRLFALVYRQLLESQHIRKNLSCWIDQTFGLKQTTDSGKTKNQISSGNNQVKTSCHIRNPLFTSPHPISSVENQREVHCDIPVIPGVLGIVWGDYVGSPSKNPPSIMSRKHFSLTVVAFVPLMTNSVHVVFSKTAPLFIYNHELVLETGQKENIREAHLSLLHWNPNNGIIGIREKHILKPVAFCPPRDPITVCSTAPDYPRAWIGLSSGTIFVFKFLFDNFKLTVADGNAAILLGHSDKINGICLSRPFGVAVSISEDKSAIIWDLNKVSFIRSITGMEFPLTNVAISDTLGDIATVGYDETTDISSLRMHTIDGALIGSICSAERITAVCFSTAPEGISVNVVAAAFQNGIIRLWSTWDLSAVSVFSGLSSSPIISLTYSFDSQYLYAATDDGYVTVWRNSDKTSVKNRQRFTHYFNLTD